MINTLVALMAAMTVGTIVLIIMETPPIRPHVRSLIAAVSGQNDPLELIHRTDVPLNTLKWQNIVVHASGLEGDAIIDKCHFIVEQNAADGSSRIRPTELWIQQIHSNHIRGPNSSFNENSIAICLVGNFTNSGPARGQFQELVSLARSLQFAFQISRGHVYLHRDLDAGSLSPGRSFPVGQFNDRLLRSSR